MTCPRLLVGSGTEQGAELTAALSFLSHHPDPTEPITTGCPLREAGEPPTELASPSLNPLGLCVALMLRCFVALVCWGQCSCGPSWTNPHGRCDLRGLILLGQVIPFRRLFLLKGDMHRKDMFQSVPIGSLSSCMGHPRIPPLSIAVGVVFFFFGVTF